VIVPTLNLRRHITLSRPLLPLGAFNNATFVYDGDGKRVKSTFNSTTTTYFVGAHYEVTGSTITKYYYAGAQRIAMRTNGTLNYLLGDHLGSTSLVTDATGHNPIETRYKAWGETRYASGTTPTKYTYTGQYSNMGDFGLMFYNARWYDPSLGRFVQADSIVPSVYDSQSYDRFAYVLNNPVRYKDPSGHKCEEDNADCFNPITWLTKNLESKYDISLVGGWDRKELLLLSQTLDNLAEYAGGAENLNDIFLDGLRSHPNNKGNKLIFNNVGEGASDPPCNNGGYACWDGESGTILVSDYIFSSDYQFNRQGKLDTSAGAQETFVHEISHVFADARPAMVGLYGGFVDNPTSIHHQPTTDCMNECIYEENMATTIARYIITGNIKAPDQLQFVLQTQHYWQAWP
jgi:RHS repeat-associated protein